MQGLLQIFIFKDFTLELWV